MNDKTIYDVSLGSLALPYVRKFKMDAMDLELARKALVQAEPHSFVVFRGYEDDGREVYLSVQAATIKSFVAHGPTAES